MTVMSVSFFIVNSIAAKHLKLNLKFKLTRFAILYCYLKTIFLHCLFLFYLFCAMFLHCLFCSFVLFFHQPSAREKSRYCHGQFYRAPRRKSIETVIPLKFSAPKLLQTPGFFQDTLKVCNKV